MRINTWPIVSHRIPALVVSRGIDEDDIIRRFPINRVSCVGEIFANKRSLDVVMTIISMDMHWHVI